jgi:Rrf2 family protein
MLRMMLDLANHQNEGYISLKDIAERQGISKKYLEQIIPLLNRSDMLLTSRGYHGGYRLAKAPEQYTVGEILQLAEGNLAPVACLQGEGVNCDRAEDCITLPIWQGLYRVINEYLDSITLKDVLEQAVQDGGSFCI